MGQAPLAGDWKVLRNGKVIAESSGAEMKLKITEAGNYRAEVWLGVAGEKKIWILTNPIYVSEK
jgi:hypothetical protein